MMNTNTINFGIIGCGMIGKHHADVIIQSKNAVLTAVYDVHRESAERFSKEYACLCAKDLDELFDEVDAVAICLPTDLHYDAVIKAASAGKHVICEKPMTSRVSLAEDMIRCCRENNVLFSVIFQHRFDTAVQALKTAIVNGELGKILWASSRSVLYRNQEYFTEKNWRQSFGSGALLNQAIHYIDLLIYLLGDPINVVGQCNSRLHTQNNNEDVGLAIVNFENGVPAVIEGTTTAYPGLFNELSVYGENGTFIIRNDELFSYWLKSGNKREYDELLNPNATYTKFRDANINISSHMKQYEDFINAILTKSTPAVDGDEGIRSLRLIQAIYESSDKKEHVRL